MRRVLRGVLRWSWRLLLLGAVANLGWDLWAWRDRLQATGPRQFYRAAERSYDIDYGVAEIRIVNETGRDWLIDSFVLDGWGGPYTHRPDAWRSLSSMGHAGSTRAERRNLDRLVGKGELALRDPASGVERVVTFQVDRRRPISCRIELRIREDGEVVSRCEALPRVRHRFRWLFNPPQD